MTGVFLKPCISLQAFTAYTPCKKKKKKLPQLCTRQNNNIMNSKTSIGKTNKLACSPKSQ